MIAKHVESLSQWVAKSAMVLATLFLVLMALHVSLDVGLRYLFGKSFTGTLEFVSFYYMVAVVFLPLAYVELQREHISVDVLVGRLPSIAQLTLSLFRHALLPELSRCSARYGSNGNGHGQLHLLSMAQSLGVTSWLRGYVPGHPRQHD